MADVLKSLKYEIDRKSLDTIYFSFIRPKLEYASHVWDNCSKQDAEQLEKFQLNIARTVTGARKGTSHELLYNETSWPTLSERRSWNKLSNFAKIVNKETPEYLQMLLPDKVGDRRPTSRNANDYKLVKTRTEYLKKILSHQQCITGTNYPLKVETLTIVKLRLKPILICYFMKVSGMQMLNMPSCECSVVN